MKLGAVIIPATTLLGPDDLVDRVERGNARHVIVGGSDAVKFDGAAGAYSRIAVGDGPAGWEPYEEAYEAATEFVPDGPTQAGDPLLLYFTSGTTAKPKLVEHTHASYPIGHLSTMYWIGLQPGDVHLNISSPGWAKHAWSNVFAPWNAEAVVLVYNYARFEAKALLEQIVRCGVTTMCAPPTVWRMLIQEDLSAWRVPMRELVAAGEPLNPEVIEQVRRAWGITIRDGYGQTETTAQIGNPPGAPVNEGSMGRPLPGYEVETLSQRGHSTSIFLTGLVIVSCSHRRLNRPRTQGLSGVVLARSLEDRRVDQAEDVLARAETGRLDHRLDPSACFRRLWPRLGRPRFRPRRGSMTARATRRQRVALTGSGARRNEASAARVLRNVS